MAVCRQQACPAHIFCYDFLHSQAMLPARPSILLTGNLIKALCGRQQLLQGVQDSHFRSGCLAAIQALRRGAGANVCQHHASRHTHVLITAAGQLSKLVHQRGGTRCCRCWQGIGAHHMPRRGVYPSLLVNAAARAGGLLGGSGGGLVGAAQCCHPDGLRWPWNGGQLHSRMVDELMMD